MLSTRGRKKATEPLRPDFALFDRAQQNLYAADNTDGAITLCIAENLLLWDDMRLRLEELSKAKPWPDWIAAYAPMVGHPHLREAVAGFVGRHIAGQPLEADLFCVSAGATAVVEISAFCLGDAGDRAVFPAPAYQAYRPDVQSKAGLERYDIQHYDKAFGDGFHPLSVTELDRAYEQLGPTFRMLVLTQPDNPTGAIYSADQLEEFADWCIAHEVHLIVNEIYALSQFTRENNDVRNKSTYTSFLPLLQSRDSEHLHWWYSFSKDFGISGFRVGLLYSRNAEFRSAYTNYNAPHQVSNLTQYLLGELLNDDGWVSEYQRRNREVLTEAYRAVALTLDRLNVPYTHARGSLFVWADFSDCLPAKTQEAAEAWWEQLFENTGVLITAPGGLGQPEVGWYRIVYSCVNKEALEEAMRRLVAFV